MKLTDKEIISLLGKQVSCAKYMYIAAKRVMPLWDRCDIRDDFNQEFRSLSVALEEFKKYTPEVE